MICALHSIWNCIKHYNKHHLQCSNRDNTDDAREDLHEQERPRLIPHKHFWLLKRELKKVTAMVLSLNIKSLHSHKINSKWINSAAKGVLSYMEKEFLVHADQLDNNFKFAFDKAFKLFGIH